MRVLEYSGRKILQPCSLDWLNYQIDPYIGCEHHCSYCYTLNQNDTEKTKEIIIFKDIAGQLIDELTELEPQTIYMGMNTDPYQPSEKIYQQTRKVLELLAHRGFSVCILTKSDLIVRDIDLFKAMPGSSAGISIAFQDKGVRKLFETKAPPTKKRINALKKLKQAGIETYTLITPVMPFITDVGLLIQKVVPYSGTIWIYGLRMESQKDRNWQKVNKILESHFPDLVEKYKEIAFLKTHSYWKELWEKLERLKQEQKVNLEIRL
jgi:DNA repair photolyase